MKMLYINACIFGKFKVFPVKVILLVTVLIFCLYFGLNTTDRKVAYIGGLPGDAKGIYLEHKQTQLDMDRFFDDLASKKDLSVHDLLKSFSNILEDAHHQIDGLEKEVWNLKHIKSAVKDNCSIQRLEENEICETRFNWLKEMWESDSCYSEWGVDGSDCSIYRYLSRVEDVCPEIPQIQPFQHVSEERLLLRKDFNELNKKFGDIIEFKWVKQRINRFNDKWLTAVKEVKSKLKTENWIKKNILFHMALLDEENGWDIGRKAFKGGPLGELVQWADLIAIVYLLGHNITITHSLKHIQERFLLLLTKSGRSYCPLKEMPFDIIYTDLSGVRMFKKVAGHKFETLTCEMRILDSFGSESEFLYSAYGQRKGHDATWGIWNINSLQFNTMFPHTPDNTFMGFVTEDQTDKSISTLTKANISVVYAKRDVFWKGKTSYIDAIHEVSKIYATVSRSENITYMPSYVSNYGVLPGDQLQELLKKTKIFVGLGFPFEGPAPLEAIANGAVFLNPKFSLTEDINKVEKFYKSKPTTRRLTSQNPYAEQFIGPPYVYTIDINDIEAVKKVIFKIFNAPQIKPFVPFEFTFNGMMERIGLQIEKQDFCKTNNSMSPWPPLSALQLFSTTTTSTCNEECSQRGLICEPSFYPFINERSSFRKLGIMCKQYFVPNHYDEEVDYPGHLNGICYLQSNKRLFSCTGRYTAIHHLCPCRDFIQQQVALCKDCYL